MDLPLWRAMYHTACWGGYRRLLCCESVPRPQVDPWATILSSAGRSWTRYEDITLSSGQVVFFQLGSRIEFEPLGLNPSQP
eukprot:CAMPEP_0184690480 /NCGR_PEP_ID=MMETSP0312-20130426/31252_1 /TAXON_ID=31354 /ORGANISM="Compsopogon coeruleus, Strain SAG 36.94" /LENGTH=80 /DNA_ID=CAMNT_0027147981 /DNA_START=528 /DNA_END=770 /DNA_ORIENTATION=+